MRAPADLLAGYYHAVHKVTLEYVASVTAEELEPRRRHALDTAGHCERATRQHHRRLRAASRAGRLHPRHRRLTWQISPAAERCCCGRGSLSWHVRAGLGGRQDARRRSTTGFIDVSAPRLRAGCCSSPTRGCWPPRCSSASPWRSTCGRRRLAVVMAAIAARRHRRSSGCSKRAVRTASATARLPTRAATRPRSSIVMGMLVLLAGAAWWAVVVAAVVSVLGAVGQGVTYHYFTDTVGALLLGSALVCVAAVATKLDRCQPRCDADHSTVSMEVMTATPEVDASSSRPPSSTPRPATSPGTVRWTDPADVPRIAAGLREAQREWEARGADGPRQGARPLRRLARRAPRRDRGAADQGNRQVGDRRGAGGAAADHDPVVLHQDDGEGARAGDPSRVAAVPVDQEDRPCTTGRARSSASSRRGTTPWPTP